MRDDGGAGARSLSVRGSLDSGTLWVRSPTVSWRATADEIKYCFEDAEAAAVAFDGASGDAAAEAAATLKIDPRRVIIAADGKGEGFKFRINGVDTYIKGANWIHYGKGDTEADTQLSPGTHKLTLAVGDDKHMQVPGLCSTITVTAQ